MNKVVKIVVIVAIVFGIAGVWMIKNKPMVSDEDVSQLNEVQITNSEEALLQTEEKEREPVDSEVVPNEVVEDENTEIVTTKEEPKKEEVSVKNVEETIKEESSVKDETEEKQDLVEVPINHTQVAQEPQKEEIPVEEVVIKVVTPDLVATEFDLEKLKAYKLPIMIEFGASWCTWCRWMEPTLEELNKEYAGKVVIQSVDVEKFRNEVSGFDVSLLPTIYFFDADGNVFETRVGAMVKEDIVKVFESMGVKND